MKVINLFGGPGCGKSTVAAEIFVWLKKAQEDVELVTEYAKDLVYEERQNILNDQIYVFAKQNRRLSRLRGKGVKVAITDSPLLLSAIYDKSGSKTLEQLHLEVFNSYNNENYFLLRPDVPYKSVGRQQTLEQAKEIDRKVLKFLEKHNIEVKHVTHEDLVEKFSKLL